MYLLKIYRNNIFHDDIFASNVPVPLEVIALMNFQARHSIYAYLFNHASIHISIYKLIYSLIRVYSFFPGRQLLYYYIPPQPLIEDLTNNFFRLVPNLTLTNHFQIIPSLISYLILPSWSFTE